MMKPVLLLSTPLILNGLFRLVGVGDMHTLPRCDDFFCWMLGACEGKEGDPSQCAVCPENKHPTSAQVSDDYAIQLAQILQPGADKYIAKHGNKLSRT